MEQNTQPELKTIIFYIVNSEDGIKSVKDLTDDIKIRDDANHRLYFKFLMAGAYMVSMGCEDTDGVKHFIGNHEIIFIPHSRQRDIERLKELKNVVWYKNCMVIAGDGEKPKALRQLLIDWLLELNEFVYAKKEEFNYEKE